VSSGSSLHAKVWLSNGTTFPYAEQTPDFRGTTGVCFSGGGTRALAAAMGQLRGLTQLNLIAEIDYLSAVSGGAWAAALYSYYKTLPPGADAPIDDEAFLGPVTAPGDLQVNAPATPGQNWLGYDGPERLGTAATRSLIESLVEVIGAWTLDALIAAGGNPLEKADWVSALKQIPWERLWGAAIGLTCFKPFGLFTLVNPFDPSSVQAQSLFSLDAATVADIKQRNSTSPAIANAPFDTVRSIADGDRRPYLVISSCVLGPSDLAPFTTECPVAFEYTPLYAGSAYSPNGSDVTYGPGVSLLIGSGFVEPFVLGGASSPAAPPAPCTPAAAGAWCVNVAPPAAPFTLADASGASSAAFAAAVEENPQVLVDHLHLRLGQKILLDALIELLDSDEAQIQLAPRTSYWPVTTSADAPDTLLTFGDGGNLENYGLIALLRRKVTQIVVFINTATPLNLDYDPAAPPGATDIDYNLTTLFGYTGRTAPPMLHNQVFPQSEFAALVTALQSAKRNAGPVMATCVHTLAANSWWGVEGAGTVTILWVYNDRVPAWESLLPSTTFLDQHLGETTLAAAIAAGNGTTPAGPLPHFPNYLTVDEDKLALDALTPLQVNLLAELSCWNVVNDGSAALFRSVLTSSGGGPA
jgi:Patatin-like phospholipase